ncbi:1-phosphofructokinase [Paenibacillus aquistagni]|uniref:1-phosphofructokinase n=1 Tax=Paenibacillus aquistagni TaxID=1852522 RepID=UPI000B506CC3|nr:1-phosphofructokinase [Paenibacillus aquistagni]
MIYTVTLNPSIDYYVYVDTFQVGGLNRMSHDIKYPGGKGINVSRVLSRIGIETKALGFIGGFTGRFIQEVLTQEGIATDFVQVDGDTRINIKLKTAEETEINGAGPNISASQLQELFGKIEEMDNSDTLILAGSIPSSLDDSLYSTMMKRCLDKDIRVVVDTSGKAMLELLRYKPFLVKPNQHELGEFFGVAVNTLEEVIQYGRKLVEMGAQHCIVSMAGDGAVLITADEAYVANVPQGKLINSVGAGDSLVAGFIGTFVRTGSVQQAFAYGVATGSATAFSTDLCTQERIEELLPQIKLTQAGERTS